MPLSLPLKGPTSALTLLSSLALPQSKAEEPERLVNEIQNVSYQVSTALEESALQIYNFQRLSADRCSFQWNGKMGKSYQVEMSHDLKSWQTLPGGLLRLEKPEDAFCEVENLTGYRSCFFRVSEVLEPFLDSSSTLDASEWTDYVSRFSETLSFEDQQALLAGTFTVSPVSGLEISVADKQAEVKVRIAGFPKERASLISQDKYLVQQHNQRIYEQAVVAALKRWFPNENYGVDKAHYLSTNAMSRSLDIEVYNRGGYRKEKDNNFWNQYFQDLEQQLWKDFEEYKKEKETFIWKKNHTTPVQEIDFDRSLEELFPVTYEINDSNRVQFEEYIQDILSSTEAKIPLYKKIAEIQITLNEQQIQVDEWAFKASQNSSWQPGYESRLSVLNYWKSQKKDLEDQIVEIGTAKPEARAALLLQPEFLQKEIERFKTQIALDLRDLELRISDAANAESLRTGEPKRWIVPRLWTKHPYSTEKAALDKKSWVLNDLNNEFLKPDVFTRAHEIRSSLARNNEEKKSDYRLLREQSLQREAFLEAQKILLPADLDFRDFEICTQAQQILEKKRTDDLSWTQDKKRIQNILPTLTALRSWDDFLYNELLVGSLNQSDQNIVNSKQHFFSEQARLVQQATNSYAHHQLNKYWSAHLSSRTPFHPDYEPTLRNLVYNAHNAFVVAHESMAQTQYFVRNPMAVEADRDFYQNQLQILSKAEKIYFGVLEEAVAELKIFWEARKNYTLELYLWVQKDPATRGAKPVFDSSLVELLGGLEKMVNDALLRATVYGQSHKNVAKKDLYGNPEETLAQLLGTMKYFDSPQGRAVTEFKHQQAFNELIRPGGALYEKYKHDERFVDPETGELISTLNIAKAESGMYPSLSGGRDPKEPLLPLENPKPEDLEHLLGESFQYLSVEERERRLSLALAAYGGEGVDLEKDEINFDKKLLEGMWQPAQGVLDFFKNRFWVVDESFLSGEFRAYYSTIDDIFDREIATHEVFIQAIKKEFSVGDPEQKEIAYNLAVLITKLILIKEMTGTTSLDKKIKNAQEDLAWTGVFPEIIGDNGYTTESIPKTHPIMRYRSAKAYSELIQLGLNVGIRYPFRTFIEQDVLYQSYLNGGPIAATPGSSFHNYGLAIDLFEFKDGVPTNDNRELIVSIAEKHGLHWSLGWYDPPHFTGDFGLSKEGGSSSNSFKQALLKQLKEQLNVQEDDDLKNIGIEFLNEEHLNTKDLKPAFNPQKE